MRIQNFNFRCNLSFEIVKIIKKINKNMVKQTLGRYYKFIIILFFNDFKLSKKEYFQKRLHLLFKIYSGYLQKNHSV